MNYIGIYLPGTKIRISLQLEYLFHRNVEQPRLEGTSKDHLVQLFVGQGASMRLSYLSNPILKTSTEGDYTVSLGSSSDYF